MVTQVIKSTGEKVPFSAKKIIGAITRAAKDAKLSPEEINKIVTEVSNKAIQFAEAKEKVLSSEIRDVVLGELDVIAPAVSAEWRRFMNKR
jgi:transcriptional regulator NrdR family protein